MAVMSGRIDLQTNGAIQCGQTSFGGKSHLPGNRLVYIGYITGG